MRRFLRAQLGWLARLPWLVKALLPLAGAGLFWAAAVPMLAAVEIVPNVPRPEALWSQAGLVALASVLAWKWFFAALFFLHALNTYVYLGTHPVWAFIGEVGKGLLRPLAFLRIGKLDLAPFLATIVLFIAAELLIRPFACRSFERFLA
jgi:uncharacterized protein YggT (Ycf19 family)